MMKDQWQPNSMLTVPLIKTNASLLPHVTAEAYVVEGTLGMEPREKSKG